MVLTSLSFFSEIFLLVRGSLARGTPQFNAVKFFFSFSLIPAHSAGFIQNIYEKEPKTATSIRDIPMPDALISDLIMHMEWFRQADERFDERLDEYYLAVNIYRLPIFPHSVGQYLKRYEREWNMKKVTCHGLRHTYCSLLLSQNVPIQTVSKYMGHSDSTVTLKVYSHFIPDTQDTALNALNNIVK